MPFITTPQINTIYYPPPPLRAAGKCRRPKSKRFLKNFIETGEPESAQVGVILQKVLQKYAEPSAYFGGDFASTQVE